MAEFALTINGSARTATTDPLRSLLEVLREDFHLTGTKYGCGEGQCRGCTVLLDGEPVISCLMPVSRAAGKAITTIEGLAQGDKPGPVQQAFLAEGFQCGFCASGFIMRAHALLKAKPSPSDDEIVEALDGNLCRCCNYLGAMRAVRTAAGRSAEGTP